MGDITPTLNAPVSPNGEMSLFNETTKKGE